MNPTLRPLSFQQIHHQGQTIWLLQDPLQLSEQQLAFPYHLARLVSEIDGTRSPQQLHHDLCISAGENVPFQIVDDVLAQLDRACLLENARSQEAVAKVKSDYLAQPYRPPAFAGLSYPDDPAELHDFLEAYSVDDVELSEWQGWNGSAMIAPHIDYQRGGKVYAKTWQPAREAVESADLIIIWGTDHSGGRASITLSHLPYATPYGVLPTDHAIVDQLAHAIGEDHAYHLELNHRQEHSIELSAVWLHHIRSNPCPVIPILVGSFHHFTPNGHPSSDQRLTKLITALQTATKGKKVLSVASVDFAHVGPAFDSDYKVDHQHRQRIATSDANLRNAIRNGDAESFYQQIAHTRNENNICGFSPIYLMMQFQPITSGVDVGYEQCSADRHNTSIVSIAGMLLNP